MNRGPINFVPLPGWPAERYRAGDDGRIYSRAKNKRVWRALKPTPSRGRPRIALVDENGKAHTRSVAALICRAFHGSRFHAPDGRLATSFDCSYQWHRVSPEERTDPPAWEDTSPALRALLSIILVEATNGVILALRTVTYSPSFTRSFHRAIADQAGLPYDPAAHDAAVADIVRRLSTEQLWERCTVRCVGGE